MRPSIVWVVGELPIKVVWGLQAPSLRVFKNKWLTIGARDEPGLENTFVLNLINTLEFISKPLCIGYYKWVLQHQRAFILERNSLGQFFVLGWDDGEGFRLPVDEVHLSSARNLIQKALSLVLYFLHPSVIITLHIIREDLLRELIGVWATAKRHPLAFREAYLWGSWLGLDCFQFLYQRCVFTLDENVISCSCLICAGNDI